MITSAIVLLVELVLLLVVIAAVLLYVLQDRLLYMPVIPWSSLSFRLPEDNPDQVMTTPDVLGIEFESIMIDTADVDVQLHAWFLRNKAEHRDDMPTVIFFHGNAGNIGHRLPFADDLMELTECNLVLVEYRGYGHSGGEPTEEALISDAEYVLDFVLNHQDVNPNNCFIFGRSVGAAVAIGLCEKLETEGKENPLRGLIIENTFLSVPKLVRDKLKHAFEGGEDVWDVVTRYTVTLQWENASRIKKIPFNLPVLFLSAELDEIVPRAHMVELFVLSNAEDKKLITIRGGDHNMSWVRSGYMPEVRNFLKTH